MTKTGEADLRALVVDDEPLARDQMRRLLRAQGGVKVVAECDRGDAAAEAIVRLQPDVVFLDVQMPGLDGFGVVAKVGEERMPATVFVTAYSEHAVQALRVAAVDYLIKPVDPQELSEALARARKKIAERLSPASSSRQPAAVEAPSYLRRLVVKDAGRMVIMDVDDVDRIEANRNYVMVHSGKKRAPVRATLAEIIDQLDPARFARVHRSTIVNLSRVREVQPWFRGEYVAILTDGSRVSIGSTFREGFLRQLKGGSAARRTPAGSSPEVK